MRDLAQPLVDVWVNLKQTIVDKAMDPRRKRLWACAKAKTQHQFDTCCDLRRDGVIEASASARGGLEAVFFNYSSASHALASVLARSGI